MRTSTLEGTTPSHFLPPPFLRLRIPVIYHITLADYPRRLFILRRPEALAEKGVTHVLSALNVRPAELEDEGAGWRGVRETFKHHVVDVDDVDDEDLLVHFPKAVRFIEEGLHPQGGEAEEKPKGGVYVHCVMGKSRSVSVVAAYLLWKHPHRFGRSAASAADPSSAKGGAAEAVDGAIDWVRRTRPMGDPNWGFRSQLRLWWEMGCPEDVESHPVYKRWAYKREVERSVAVGMAPELKFEDEAEAEVPLGSDARHNVSSTSSSEGPELRCRKCRMTLATARFIVSLDHNAPAASRAAEEQAPLPSPPKCPHYFVEPLSWMRSTLEAGELEGRLVCPGQRCGASVGRYSWRGFQCSCGEWVTPAFSLGKAKVDVVARTVRAGAYGIRMPPGAKNGAGPKENL